MHELEILRAVANGATAKDLSEFGWAPADVDAVLNRHNLMATPGGSIVRRGVPVPPLLQLAGNSASPRVQQLAERTRTAMLALQKALGQDYAAQQSEVVRHQQLQAIDEFVGLIKQIESDARSEFTRLSRMGSRSRSAKAAS